MANLFANLPLPAMNGAGASVNTAGMGSPKTITVEGSFPGTTITIEASVDGGIVWAPITVFQSGGSQLQLNVAAEFLRTNVSGRNSALPFSANVDVGAPDSGAQFIAIPLPVANGPGAAVNVSTFGVSSTFIAGGSFAGAVIRVEISEDNIAWAPLVQFAGKGGIKTHDVTAQFVRSVVSGRVSTVTFTGSLAMGSVNDAITIGGVDVQDESVSIPNNPHTTLNFVGAGVTASDAGGGVATINIPGGGGIMGVDLSDEGVPLAGNPKSAINFVGGGVVAADAGGANATITVPGETIQDEGIPLAGFPHATLNFIGAGVTASDAGGGVAEITIPGGISGVTISDEGAPIAGNPKTALNFVGGGVVASDAGGASATVTVPGETILDEGAPIAGAPHFSLNFVGAGVAATNGGGGVATITIPGETATDIMFWGDGSIAASADTRFLDPGSGVTSPLTDTMQIPLPRSGTVRNLFVRHNTVAGNGNNVVYTVMKNGVATAITVTLASGAVGQASDVANSDAFVQGDRISIRAVKALAIGAGGLDVQASIEVG